MPAHGCFFVARRDPNQTRGALKDQASRMPHLGVHSNAGAPKRNAPRCSVARRLRRAHPRRRGRCRSQACTPCAHVPRVVSFSGAAWCRGRRRSQTCTPHAHVPRVVSFSGAALCPCAYRERGKRRNVVRLRTLHASRLTLHASHFTLHTSRLTLHTSHLTLHTSYPGRRQCFQVSGFSSDARGGVCYTVRFQGKVVVCRTNRSVPSGLPLFSWRRLCFTR